MATRLPSSFLESAFSTKVEYEASLAMSDEERRAAEHAAQARRAGCSSAPPSAAPQASLSSSAAPASASARSSASGAPTEPPRAPPTARPTAVIIIGMAGSGKTTLMQRLNAHLHNGGTPYYMVNLDPAVLETPFGANIDIRDTVNYREVMRQYSLGPNGGILTALNLFATRFEQVLSLIGKRAASASPPKYALFDTPGQIEIFTWSASGQIVCESLAATYPTVIVYVVDTVRCKNAVTFMSNMLYACSILYKLKLPLVLAFNKTDASACDFALEWMTNLDAFSEALQEFYNSLHAVGVSALTGEGIDDFFGALDKAAAEYEHTYGAELERIRERRAEEARAREERNRAAMAADGLQSAGASVLLDSGRHGAGPGVPATEGGDSDSASDEDADGGGRLHAARAGYTVEDELYAQENPDDQHELESLRRYLASRRLEGGSTAES